MLAGFTPVRYIVGTSLRVGSSAHMMQICAGYEQNVHEEPRQFYQRTNRRAWVSSSTTWACIVHGDKHQHSSNRFLFVSQALWGVWISFDTLISTRVTDTAQRTLVGMLPRCHSVFGAENMWSCAPGTCSNQRLDAAANG